ncbi:MAG: ComF family protein [bacterium]|nr:ComF family protein [bacterium]
MGSALGHESAARRLVHLLKYQGLRMAGEVLGAAMVTLVPPGATTLVPVPRAVVRKMKYGTDPALVLAGVVGAAVDLPVVSALAARLWWPAHAGMDRDSRRSPRFRVVAPAPAGSVLVDDVLTTGATLAAAGQLLGVGQAITATRAGTRGCG